MGPALALLVVATSHAQPPVFEDEYTAFLDSGDLVEFGMGGPFLTYTFYDQPSGRIYIIDGMVFAPGYNKREFLRQLEVIAHTFRSQQDAQTEGAVASQ